MRTPCTSVHPAMQAHSLSLGLNFYSYANLSLTNSCYSISRIHLDNQALLWYYLVHLCGFSLFMIILLRIKTLHLSRPVHMHFHLTIWMHNWFCCIWANPAVCLVHLRAVINTNLDRLCCSLFYLICHIFITSVLLWISSLHIF